MVKVNVITGFLGAGKTTLIRSLLGLRPAGERWAVLVNEFGDIGIDGALLSDGASDVTIKEVPGGCLCCANGLPFQIALNQLIGRTQPDRLLIEPTGLGHPREILSQLQAPHLAGLMQLYSTLTLVDARKLSDSRYRSNPLFNQQIAVADRVLAAKADTYEPQHLMLFEQYLHQNEWRHKPWSPVRQGMAQLDWLNGVAAELGPSSVALPAPELPLLSLAPVYNAQGFVFRTRRAGDWFSAGWAFDPNLTFDAHKLWTVFSGLVCERLKAVIITPDDVIGFNAVDGVLSQRAMDDCLDSRVEILNPEPLDWAAIEQQLLAAISSGGRAGSQGTSV